MIIEAIPGGNVTSPAGFQAGSIHCGLKVKKEDLAILCSEVPAVGAAAFTQNRAAAAPIQISRQVFANHRVQAVLINSGNANACTGEQGLADAHALQAKTAVVLGVSPDLVALASTGCIGVLLPMDHMLSGIERAAAVLGPDQGTRAAIAIQTSDTTIKESAMTTIIDGKQVTIGGMAKGSGMIHPNMATMLSFVTTDAAVDPVFLNRVVSEVVQDTYNMITVDGDASTNDTVMVLANGKAGNRLLDEHHPEKDRFVEMMFEVNKALATAIVRDGEGATKFIEAVTAGFTTKEDARKAAKAVLMSTRVKTSLFAEDGYWGRIISSLGNSGAEFDLSEISLQLGNGQGQRVKVLENGRPLDYDEKRVTEVLQDNHLILTITADSGDGAARGWGCDLSYEYVKISGFYRQRS